MNVQRLADDVSGNRRQHYGNRCRVAFMAVTQDCHGEIAIGNAGPVLALESMGAKRYFRCHFLNIGPSYKQ